MNLTVIIFFRPSVFLCYVPAPYLLNDWKLIEEMSKALTLVVGWYFGFNGSFSQYYSLPERDRRNQIYYKQEKNNPNNPT